MIMSTRENRDLRRRTFALGVSQISAAAGPTRAATPADFLAQDGQFQLGDSRPLDEVVRDCAELGYVPSFCTACYRWAHGNGLYGPGQAGRDQGALRPNALSCFQEYLLDYASPETRAAGDRLIRSKLAEMEPRNRAVTEQLLQRLRANEGATCFCRFLACPRCYTEVGDPFGLVPMVKQVEWLTKERGDPRPIGLVPMVKQLNS